MPNHSKSSNRWKVALVAVAALATIVVVLVGHRLSAAAEHTIGPDLAYAGFIGLLCAGGIVLWALTLRSSR